MRTTLKAAITACAISVVSSVALSTSAMAAPIYSSSETSAAAWGTPSDVSFNQAWAQGFSSENDAIARSISWDGFYRLGDADTDKFTINFYEDTLLSGISYSVNVDGAVKRQDSGIDSWSGANIYSFSADIGEFALKANTDYYVSIVANTDNKAWAWAGGEDSSIDSWGSFFGGAFRPSFTSESVFTLDDAKLPVANVSEPGTLALLLGGVVALAARRRKA